MPDVQLVVPCYRPAPGWGQRLATRFARFAEALPDTDVGLVLVDDEGQGALSPLEVQRLEGLSEFVYVAHASNRGKGAALRTGTAAATAPLILYTDVDLPYTLASMLDVYATLRSRGGVVAGERKGDYYETVPTFRRRLSHAHRALMRHLFRLPVVDSQAGLKGFDAVGRAVFLETTIMRFLVDLDFLARCRRRVPVHPVRVTLRPDVTFTDFGIGVLAQEAGNFARVFRGSWFGWS